MATPTEVVAVGAVLSLLLGVCFHNLTWSQLVDAMVFAIKTNSMIMFIVIGARMLSTSVIFFNVALKLARFVSIPKVSPMVILAAVSRAYIAAEMFLDGMSMLLNFVTASVALDAPPKGVNGKVVHHLRKL